MVHHEIPMKHNNTWWIIESQSNYKYQTERKREKSSTLPESNLWALYNCTDKMEKDSEQMAETTNQQERDMESNSLHQPLLKRNLTALSSSPLALVGAKVSYIESLDYE